MSILNRIKNAHKNGTLAITHIDLQKENLDCGEYANAFNNAARLQQRTLDSKIPNFYVADLTGSKNKTLHTTTNKDFRLIAKPRKAISTLNLQNDQTIHLKYNFDATTNPELINELSKFDTHLITGTFAYNCVMSTMRGLVKKLPNAEIALIEEATTPMNSKDHFLENARYLIPANQAQRLHVISINDLENAL